MKISFVELINYLYVSGLMGGLRPKARLLAMILLFKANDLSFPESFRISNEELAKLTGMSKRTVTTYKKELAQKCPLFSYVPTTHQEGGTFSINYKLLTEQVKDEKVNPSKGDDPKVSEPSSNDEEQASSADKGLTSNAPEPKPKSTWELLPLFSKDNGQKLSMDKFEIDLNSPIFKPDLPPPVFKKDPMPSFISNGRNNSVPCNEVRPVQNGPGSSASMSGASDDQADTIENNVRLICGVLGRSLPEHYVMGEEQQKLIKDLAKFPRSRIKTVIDIATRNRVKPYSILDYLRKSLLNSEEAFKVLRELDDLLAENDRAIGDDDPSHWKVPENPRPCDPWTWQESKERYIEDLDIMIRSARRRLGRISRESSQRYSSAVRFQDQEASELSYY